MKAAIVNTLLTVAAPLLLIFGLGQSCLLLCQTRYTPCDVHDGGTITGEVTLTGVVSKFDQMEISQDSKTCGKMKDSPRLVMGKNRGVADAIIYLEGVSRGKKFPENGTYLLDQHNCEYHPHILIIPAGQSLQIVNNDPILHNVHTYTTGNDAKTVFNIAQPIKGVKSRTKPLTQSGLIRVTCDAGHPWMSAHIMVADHPYYTVSDRNGDFSLPNVPPGSYTLRMWHEGISIVNKVMEHDKVKSYEFGQPYEQSRQVTVSPEGTSTVNFELPMR
jgi:plastocyanin